MSTNQQKYNNEEEVDLGSLFVIIGKGFSNFFNFIGNIFKGIFHFLISVIIFFKKDMIKIIIAGIIFGLIGYLIDFNKKTVYESKMLVQPNYNSSKQLYSNIKFYNDLVIQKEEALLMKTFNISDEEAKSLISFSIEPLINENDIINGYDKLALSVDTLAIKNYTIKEFKNSFTDFDYQVHEIKIISTKNKVFNKLDSVILYSISNNDYFKKLKEFENLNLERSSALYKKNIKETDTLRKVYMKALLEESKKTTQGTSIDMGGKNNENREIELFSTVKELNNSLTIINKEKANKSEIINVISSFQQVGNKSGSLLKSKPVLFFVLGVFVVVVFLLVRKFNRYLENYKK
jgi:hypothetical protein